MVTFTPPPAPFSAGSYATPPADLFKPMGGPTLSLAPTHALWRQGDVEGGVTLSPLLVTRVGRKAGAQGLWDAFGDPAARRHAQAVGGLGGEVLHPDPGLAAALAAIKDDGAARAAAGAYNEWVARFASADPGRFAGVAIAPATGLDGALEAVAQARKLGLKAIALVHPPGGPGSNPGGDAMDFWKAADEAGLIVALSPAFGGTAPSIAPQVAAGAAPPLAGFFSRLLFAGVPDALPNLRLLLTNVEAGWLPTTLEIADINYMRAAASRVVNLADPDRLPSEYIRGMLWLGFQHDRFSVLHRNYFGEHHLLWGASIPTDDSDWPDDEEQTARVTAGLPDEARDRLLGDNVRRLFGLAGTPFTPGEVKAFRTPAFK